MDDGADGNDVEVPFSNGRGNQLKRRESPLFATNTHLLPPVFCVETLNKLSKLISFRSKLKYLVFNIMIFYTKKTVQSQKITLGLLGTTPTKKIDEFLEIMLQIFVILKQQIYRKGAEFLEKALNCRIKKVKFMEKKA